VSAIPRRRPPSRLVLLLRTLGMCLMLTGLLMLPMQVPGPAGRVLFLLSLVAMVPALIVIVRSWRRYLWASRLDQTRAKLAAAPSDPEILAELGLLAAIHGDPLEARSAFDRARSAAPHHGNATVGLGHLLVEQGDLDGALALFTEAAEAHPDLFSAHYAIGGLHQRREQFARAIQSFEKALEIEPDDAFTLTSLARCWLDLGDVAKAESYHEQASEHGVRDRDLESDLRARRAE
jgi:Flp pilus assembly protein TadD